MNDNGPINKTGRRWLKYCALAIVAVIFMCLAVIVPAYLESKHRREQEQRRGQTEFSKPQDQAALEPKEAI